VTLLWLTEKSRNLYTRLYSCPILMTSATKHIRNLLVMFLYTIWHYTKTETRHADIDIDSLVSVRIPQIIDKAIDQWQTWLHALCKGKWTSLRTPTVI